MLFMLAGPDCARMVGEFEAIHDPPPYSTGGAQLASDVPKEYIIFRECSRVAWHTFRCNKSGAGSTRYSECHGRVRCGITFWNT